MCECFSLHIPRHHIVLDGICVVFVTCTIPQIVLDGAMQGKEREGQVRQCGQDVQYKDCIGWGKARQGKVRAS